MSAAEWQAAIAARRAPQVPAVTPQLRGPEEGRGSAQGPGYNPDVVVREGLRLLLELGALPHWLLEGRTWLTAALAYDSDGALITALSPLDAGPRRITRGADALGAVCARLMEKHRLLLLGPDPATEVRHILRARHPDWDNDMLYWQLAGRIWRTPENHIAYRPRTPDTETARPPVQRGSDSELIPLAARAVAADIERDMARAHA